MKRSCGMTVAPRPRCTGISLNKKTSGFFICLSPQRADFVWSYQARDEKEMTTFTLRRALLPSRKESRP